MAECMNGTVDYHVKRTVTNIVLTKMLLEFDGGMKD